MRQRYWVCIIGPTDQDKLPNGSDLDMRSAAEKAFKKLTGHHAEICSSGWGVDEFTKNSLISELVKHDPT